MNSFLPEYQISIFPKIISQKRRSPLIINSLQSFSYYTLFLNYFENGSVWERPIHENDLNLGLVWEF